MQVNLVHYIYIPVEDEVIAKSVWDYLIDRYGLAGFKIDEYVTGITGTAYEFPILVGGSDITIGLSVERKIITISAYFSEGVKPTQEARDELKTVRANLQEQLDYVIGETTIDVTGRDAADDSAGDRSSLGAIGDYNAGIRGGVLSYVRSDDGRRYYLLERNDSADLTNTLTKEIPRVEMLVHKLAKQSIYFRDQHSLLIGKKSEIDRDVSEVLYKWAGQKSESAQNMNRLEEDTEKLSNMYAELAGSLKIIKNANDTMTRDLDELESRLDALLVEPDESKDFRNVLLAEFKSLQTLLTFDDEVLHRTLNDIRATIEVVRTRIELERSRESFLLQKEGVSVQIAAGFIELFIVGFYTLETWHLLSGAEAFEHIPAYMRLGLDVAFAVSAVAVTHYIAKYLNKERGFTGIALSSLGIIVSAFLMVVVTRLAAA